MANAIISEGHDAVRAGKRTTRIAPNPLPDWQAVMELISGRKSRGPLI
jgi:hypothetical protein